jgi:hypothetical protein
VIESFNSVHNSFDQCHLCLVDLLLGGVGVDFLSVILAPSVLEFLESLV